MFLILCTCTVSKPGEIWRNVENYLQLNLKMKNASKQKILIIKKN